MRCAGSTPNGWCISWTRSPGRAAQAQVRGLIRDFYSDLKAFRLKPGARRAAAPRKRFGHIFPRRTGFVALDRLLKRLHTNVSETDIRCYVARRKLSAGTRGDTGRDCRDAFLGLAKTCAKLGIDIRDYLGSRLKGAGRGMASFRRSMFTSGARSAHLIGNRTQTFAPVTE